MNSPSNQVNTAENNAASLQLFKDNSGPIKLFLNQSFKYRGQFMYKYSVRSSCSDFRVLEMLGLFYSGLCMMSERGLIQMGVIWSSQAHISGCECRSPPTHLLFKHFVCEEQLIRRKARIVFMTCGAEPN